MNTWTVRWRLRPFRLLWMLFWMAFAVHTFGWTVLFPMIMLQFDAELK